MRRSADWVANLAKLLCLLAAVIVLALQTGGSVRAEAPVETLIAQVFSPKDAAAYELTAHFHGAFSLTMNGSSTGGTAAGIFREWHKPGESRRWRITVQQLDLPWLLRPFSAAVRAAIEQKAEAQSETFENFQNYDIFVSEERTGGQYVLFGLRRDVVDEAIARFGKPADKQDIASRRAIARWLATAKSMRSWIARPGPTPYALHVLADESGLIHELQVFYEKSQVSMKFSYLRVGDQLAWKEVLSTFTSTNVKGLGYLEGQLQLGLADYKLDRAPQGPQHVTDGRSDDRAFRYNDATDAPQP